MLLAPVLAEGNIPFTYRWQTKIWGDIANFCGHLPTFPYVSLASTQRHLRDYTLQPSFRRPSARQAVGRLRLRAPEKPAAPGVNGVSVRVSQ